MFNDFVTNLTIRLSAPSASLDTLQNRGVVDMCGSITDIRRDLGRLEKWADKSVVTFSKEKY